MVDAVLRAVERHRMLDDGDSVIVALSGGADSVALLHVLISIKEKYHLTVAAAHLNHLLRGEEAERDERFCKILCENNNIPFYVRRADIGAMSKRLKISEELCGRQERYAFFGELSERHSAKIATAHTASDNAETMLFNLARGASVTGASGIPPKRGVFIRPLICCTRAEIEAYCAQNRLDFVTDSTNLGDGYTRNRIRHRVIPELREINPRFESAVLRFCESAALVRDYMLSQARLLLQAAGTCYGWQSGVLLGADDAVLNEALVLLCAENAGFTPENRHLGLLRAVLKNGGAVDLGDTSAICTQGVLRFFAKDTRRTELEISFKENISFPYGDRIITAAKNTFAASDDLLFRTRRGGDTFTFGRRGVTKPLRKALNEQKIPAEQRDSLLLLCEGSTVLWCEALGFSKQGKILRDLQNLKIDIEIKEV